MKLLVLFNALKMKNCFHTAFIHFVYKKFEVCASRAGCNSSINMPEMCPLCFIVR